jgi:hypothetical protein
MPEVPSYREGGQMNILLGAFIFALFLIGFAIHKKDSVRASLSLKPFGFFLEAKNNEPPTKREQQ